MLWFTSDNHFFHTKVMEYSNRPYTTGGEMNEKMRDEWNRVVKPNDEVWMLGDVGFARYSTLAEFLKTLNGRKHLVLGNHDEEIWKNREKALADKVFHSIQHYKELKYNGHKFMLFHFAGRTWNKAQYDAIHLFGHTHGYLAPRGRSVDVGVDDKNITDEYRPVSVDEVLAFMENRKRHTNHHDGADALETLEAIWETLSPEYKQAVIDLTNKLKGES